MSGSEDGEEALEQQNQLLKKIQALLSSNDLIQVYSWITPHTHAHTHAHTPNNAPNRRSFH